MTVLHSHDFAVSKETPVDASAGHSFVFTTSFAQQRLWFLDQLEPANSLYNISRAIHLTGVLSVTALEMSFNEIVRRHEALRTTFEIIDGQPVQVISPTLIRSRSSGQTLRQAQDKLLTMPIVDLEYCHMNPLFAYCSSP